MPDQVLIEPAALNVLKLRHQHACRRPFAEAVEADFADDRVGSRSRRSGRRWLPVSVGRRCDARTGRRARLTVQQATGLFYRRRC